MTNDTAQRALTRKIAIERYTPAAAEAAPEFGRSQVLLRQRLRLLGER